jgi:hypothetical protein
VRCAHDEGFGHVRAHLASAEVDTDHHIAPHQVGRIDKRELADRREFAERPNIETHHSCRVARTVCQRGVEDASDPHVDVLELPESDLLFAFGRHWPPLQERAIMS